MSKMMLGLGGAILVTITGVASSQEPNEPCWSGGVVDVSRSYCGIDAMPKHMAFWSLSLMMRDVWQDKRDEIAVGNAKAIPRDSFAFAATVQDTDLDEVEALRMIQKLSPLFRRMAADIRTSQTRALCVPGLTFWSPEKTIRAMYQLDDVRDAVKLAYYRMAKLSLTGREEVALDRLLGGKSFSSSVVYTDYAEAYQDEPERAKEELEGLCRNWTSDSNE